MDWSRRASSTCTSSTRFFSLTATCWKRLRQRHIQFGMQTRIDLWSESMIDLLGEAGCVSIEAGVESITESGRDLLDKKCKITTAEISRASDPRKAQGAVRAGESARFHGRRPGRGPGLARRICTSMACGPTNRCRCSLIRVRPITPGDGERPTSGRGSARTKFYLSGFDKFSDIQEQRPLPLVQLESAGTSHA